MKRAALLILSLLTVSISLFSADIDAHYAIYKNSDRHNQREAGKALVELLIEQGLAHESDRITPEHTAAEIEGIILLYMGNYHFRAERYSECIDFMSDAIKLSEQENDSSTLEQAFYMTGFAYQRLGEMDRALFFSTKSYELGKQLNNEEHLSSTINMLANIYQTNNQDSIAIRFYNESIAIERRLGRKQQLAIRLGNLSTSYLKLNRLDEALSVVTEALALDRAGTRPDKVAARLTQMADVYRAMNKNQQARACLEEAYAFFDKAKSLYGMAISLNMLGELEQVTGNRAKADDYFTRAAQLAEENGNRYIYHKIARNIYLLNREHNPQKALTYFEQSVEIEDSIFNRDTQKQIDEFQVQYETTKKELEILRQQAQINRYKSIRTLFFVSLCLSLLVLLLLWWLLRLRTKRNRILAESNATKDKFFSIISHDLKNPTIAQRDALQLMTEHIELSDTAALKQFGNELLKSADSQVELLNNLLNWAQVQTGRMPFQPTQIDLVAELRNDLALIDAMAAKKEVGLTYDHPETALVVGDRNMLTTVVRNLLSNAVKFTPRLGQVTLSISAEARGGYTVAVADTGMGMSPEQVEHLFDIAVDQTRQGTEGEDGSGLGLIVCQELIARHGSCLQVESREGFGSRFWFTIA